ncbi:MAG: GNAT family protein [Pseudomonadota bacterium]|nr:GNAT family protein [Pseudomonadota bacterium]
MSCKPSMETPEIYLRELQLSDVDSWYSYLSVPEVVEHTSWNLRSKQDLVSEAKLYNLEDPESQIRFAIIYKSSGDLIGTIGFHSVCEASRSAEIAYDVHPEFWGRGIATQACHLVVEWGFKYRKFTRIQACILPSNIASEIVLQKCGFVPEGIRSSFRKVRGEPKDFKVYSIA